MTAAVLTNPAIQTSFTNTFFATSRGYVQGDALDDPAIRYSLRKALVAPAATQAMWGGLAISEQMLTGGIGVGTTNPASDLKTQLFPATSLTAGNAAELRGFTVINQAVSMIKSAQNNAPIALPSMAINYYRLGSGARIPVAASAAAAAAWLGGVVDPQTIYWDTNNLWLTNGAGSGIIGPITSVIIEDVSANQGRVVNYAQNASGFSTTGFLNYLENQPIVVLKI